MLSDQWHKSTFSGGGNGCVEARIVGDTIEVRDTKAGPDAPVQRYNRTEWAAFLAGAAAGEFDLPA